jgi:hypothetical protein
MPDSGDAEESFLNNAQSFDGNDQINVPADEAFNWGADSNFSIEVWVKYSETEGPVMVQGFYRPTCWVLVRLVGGV